MQQFMKAAVLEGARHITVKSVPVPDIGKREIMIRVSACDVCSSDHDHALCRLRTK